ncbi:RIO kinase, conserved site [Ostreococcus tauri]|uniref:Serine/threonine-protein kinase RIO1 n=2 Tax=Ostreococcus tauri TaxID=70448 RepID=A0A096PBI3_OSTTA|nr:RIO kinase, conserved site [Ostreococcus tauri]CEG01963.1 RIO kinase, conserved site [Ostreococcus tauri]|eukprot:XP_022841274.1 RIO kinase, conserved site [Ostreococcus tauri]
MDRELERDAADAAARARALEEIHGALSSLRVRDVDAAAAADENDDDDDDAWDDDRGWTASEDDVDDVGDALDALDALDDVAAHRGDGRGPTRGTPGGAARALTRAANGGGRRWTGRPNGGEGVRMKNTPSGSSKRPVGGRLDKAQKALPGTSASEQKVRNAFKEHQRKESKNASLNKDKEDRATVEQALDPRTMLILFKMLSRETFTEIHGCVSTGKEANVYHARKVSPDSPAVDFAVKVYKTSILVFKDRDRYVSGDWRWRNGYSKKNPRKMVQTWAEKEMRNLIRLKESGLRVPKVEMLRSHVLVMEFIGTDDGVAAPRLRDAAPGISTKKMRSLFTELIVDVRWMYQKCRLVHADLSEYNLLFHDGHIWIIDVSQSVDQDHPRCLEFLREDLLHVIQFFAKRDVAVPTVRELFDFVVDPAINDENMEAVLEALSESAESHAVELKKVNAQLNALNSHDPDSIPEEAMNDPTLLERAAEAEIRANVFHQAFIPRALDEVDTFERDQRRLKQGDGESEGIYYQTITGMADDLSGVRTTPMLISKRLEVVDEDEESEDGDDETDEDVDMEDGEDASGDEDDPERRFRKEPVDKEAAKAARKAAAKAQKAAAAEKRKTKIPKHVKKAKTKKAKK